MPRRLRAERARAVWVYAPGYLGLDGPNADRATALTGIVVEASPGKQGSMGEGLLEGLTWGPDADVRPRLVVRDGQAEVLGRYRTDRAVSTARSYSQGYESLFVGDIALTVEVLAKLCVG